MATVSPSASDIRLPPSPSSSPEMDAARRPSLVLFNAPSEGGSSRYSSYGSSRHDPLYDENQHEDKLSSLEENEGTETGAGEQHDEGAAYTSDEGEGDDWMEGNQGLGFSSVSLQSPPADGGEDQHTPIASKFPSLSGPPRKSSTTGVPGSSTFASLASNRDSFILSNLQKLQQHSPSISAPSSFPSMDAPIESKRASLDLLVAQEKERRRGSSIQGDGSSPFGGVAGSVWAFPSSPLVAEFKPPGGRGRRGAETEKDEDELVEESLVEGGPLEDTDVDWDFWGAVVSDYEAVARSQPQELSQAIQRGIPPVIRGSMWQLMSSSKDAELESLYSSLLHQTSPHEKSIQKDLARTFPQHAFFQRPKGSTSSASGNSKPGETPEERGRGQDDLFNVVRAYSLYDPVVGYVQGSAFIVAALLLNMPDEEAFCVFVRLMHAYGLRTCFTPEMPGLQLRLFQFDRLIEEVLPLLHIHLVRAGVKSSMFASQWFLSLFAYRFPLPLVYRIFDIIFAEGMEAVFRFALALLIKNEEQLLALEFEGILKYLSSELFDCYKEPRENVTPTGEPAPEEVWLADTFVKDAFAVKITPFQLDGFSAEWDEICRVQNAHADEVSQLRAANRHLSAQVKQLESSMALLNTEHCEVVNELVKSKIANEEMESELIKFKLLYAELSHTSDSSKQRSSQSSFWSLGRSSSSGGASSSEGK